MIDKTMIQQLKQSNASVNTDKTKERVEALWKSLSRADKKSVFDLTGVSPATIYRIYNTGSISVKLAAPVAEVLNISPFYLTGETDEKGTGDEDTLRAFLSGHGYEKLLMAQKPKRVRKTSQPATAESQDEPVKATETEIEVAAEVLAAAAEVVGEKLDEVTLDDMMLLIKALLLRARIGVPDAVETVVKLKNLLING